MKNVLIISQFFAPENIIASIRFTKVVKYLARTKDYRFWVICIGPSKDTLKDELLQRDIEEVAEYVTIIPVYMDKKIIKNLKNQYEERKKGKTISNKETDPVQKKDLYYTIQKNLVSCGQKGIVGGAKRLLGKIFLIVNDIYDLIFEYSFAQRGVALSKQIPIDNIDVMISTYGHIGSLLLALKFKGIKKDLKWIVDYRDPIRAASAIKKKILDRIVLEADNKADYITGVTKSCIGSGKQLSKFHVIPNSYDKEDIKDIYSVRNEKLTIGYTGSLYYGISDMTFLFKIIYDLSKEGKLDIKRIKVIFAGSHYNMLKNQAEKYGLEGIIDNRGKVPRKDSLQIQKQSDILCLLARNSIGDEEPLSGKILEYIMMKKPIFAIITGNKPNSSLKRIIMGSELGYCLEEVEIVKYYGEAKKWFLDKYLEFVRTGQITFNPQERKLEKYRSEKMAESFAELINA